MLLLYYLVCLLFIDAWIYVILRLFWLKGVDVRDWILLY